MPNSNPISILTAKILDASLERKERILQLIADGINTTPDIAAALRAERFQGYSSWAPHEVLGVIRLLKAQGLLYSQRQPLKLAKVYYLAEPEKGGLSSEQR